jgi:5-methylcytosine-specific restriction endonuclease McrA
VKPSSAIREDSDSALDVLGEAMLHLSAGNTALAQEHLSGIAIPPPERIARQSVPLATQAGVFARDSYICGYCGRKTICPPALRYLSWHFPDLIPYHPHGKWELTHPLYWTAYASCDHIIPVARGGTGEIDNLLTSCYKCNTMKSTWLLEELGWERYSAPAAAWDGVSRLFVQAMSTAPIDDAYFKAWLRALQRAAAT